MEVSDRQPDEDDIVEHLKARRHRLDGLAAACDAEALDREARANRLEAEASDLRDRAVSLRDRVREYDEMIGTSGPPSLGGRVSVGAAPPTDPSDGDVWFAQDNLDPTTFRRHEYSTEHGWQRLPEDDRSTP